MLRLFLILHFNVSRTSQWRQHQVAKVEVVRTAEGHAQSAVAGGHVLGREGYRMALPGGDLPHIILSIRLWPWWNYMTKIVWKDEHKQNHKNTTKCQDH